MSNNKKVWFSVTEKDCIFKDKRGSGKGGQKRNKTSNAIQCFHKPSGAVGEAEDLRKQSDNRKLAFKRMAESLEFQSWIKLKIEAGLGNIELEEVDDKGSKINRKLRIDEI
jgi:protein subunit release factor B